VKQTKTTLIFGILLAIIVIVLVTFEIKSQSGINELDKVENATVLPVGRKTISILKEIIRFR